MRRWQRLLILTLLCCLPTSAFAAVQNCTLAWNARTDADLAGYRVLWGTASGTYPNTVVLGSVTTVTCANLGITSAGTYYAVVRYHDTSGNISANSSQVSFTLATVTAPSTAPTISSFTPTSGNVGDSVTIFGTNYSTTLGSNTVTFNGTTATLSSGTTTQLVATVPGGATTGRIAVTTGAGTATSTTDFTITTAPPSTVYDSITDFSNVQGPVWYYLNGDYTQMTYASALWSGPELYQGLWDTGGHPGNSGGLAIRRWVCPATGTWNVSGITGDYDSGGGDGVIVNAVSNLTTTLFSRTITNGLSDANYSFNYTCTTGDTLDFGINRVASADYDSTHFTIHVAGSSQPPPPPTPTPPPPPTILIDSLTAATPQFNINTSAVITIILSQISTTDTIITLASADPSIVSAPTTITIPANSTTAGFTVLGSSIGMTQLTATLGTSTKHLTLTVLPTPALTPITLLAPADRATLSATQKSVILRWLAVSNAKYYQLRVIDDTIDAENTSSMCGGSNVRICELSLLSTSYRLTLKPGHTYTWSVLWLDDAGVASDETVRTFSVNLNP